MRLSATWLYSQSLGYLWAPDRKLIYRKAYSGHGAGLNNPKLEAVSYCGPLPRGDWVIGDVYNSSKVGPHAIVLTPLGHTAHKRKHFRIHGDSRKMNKSASHGCLILPRHVRGLVSGSATKILRVIE